MMRVCQVINRTLPSLVQSLNKGFNILKGGRTSPSRSGSFFICDGKLVLVAVKECTKPKSIGHGVDYRGVPVPAEREALFLRKKLINE